MYMALAVESGALRNIDRIRRVQLVTIAWRLAEAAVSLFSAWRARSSSLLRRKRLAQGKALRGRRECEPLA
jgi:hypothetical protein